MADSELNTQQQVNSIWALGGLTRRQLGDRVWHSAMEDDLLGRASELAYNFIFAIFPLMLFLLSLFGLFASRGAMFRDNLMFYLRTALPPSAYQLMDATISEVMANSGGAKLTFGIVLTLWAAAGGITSMISTLNAVYGVSEGRPWWKVRLVALSLTVAIVGLVLSALTVVLLGGFVSHWAELNLNLGAGVIAWKILQWPLSLVFITVAFSLIYYYGPDLREQHWYWITPGSLLGVLLWMAVSSGFRVYLHFFNSYSKTYGSLGAAIVLLVWFYVTGFSFLVGGEINAQIEHAAGERGHPEAKEEGQKQAA